MLVRSLLAGSVACFAAAGIGGYVTAQNLQLPIESARSVTATAEKLVGSQRLPGISFAVVADGKVVESGALGRLDATTNEPVTAVTRFEAASLTKPLVAYMVMLAVDQGTLELDEPVSEHIGTPPRIAEPERWDNVTIRHLLAHRSGLPNWSGNPNNPNRSDPLSFLFDPGVDFDYSGEGYGLLLQALASASGRSAEDLAAATLAELGMADSSMTAADLTGAFARGHWGTRAGREARRTEHAVAAFSLLTTADDYAKLLIAWLNPPVSEATAAEFAEPIRGDHFGLPPAMAWSLGWGPLSVGENTVHFQWGDNGAFRAFAGIDRASGSGIVYLTNGSLGTLQAAAMANPVLGDISTAGNWFAEPRRELARLWLRY